MTDERKLSDINIHVNGFTQDDVTSARLTRVVFYANWYVVFYFTFKSGLGHYTKYIEYCPRRHD